MHCPHCGEMTWASNSGECNYDHIKLHSIIGEMVLPGSLETPTEPCNCDIPATCTISTECSETNPVVKELIGAMTQQFSMLVGVLEKFSQAEQGAVMNSKARLEKLADELQDEFLELAKDVCHPDNEADAQIVGNNILHIINQFDECVEQLTILHLASILLYKIAEKRN